MTKKRSRALMTINLLALVLALAGVLTFVNYGGSYAYTMFIDGIVILALGIVYIALSSLRGNVAYLQEWLVVQGLLGVFFALILFLLGSRLTTTLLPFLYGIWALCSGGSRLACAMRAKAKRNATMWISVGGFGAGVLLFFAAAFIPGAPVLVLSALGLLASAVGSAVFSPFKKK